MTTSPSKNNTWLDRPVFSFWPNFTIYHLIVALILITAILSRFIMLGERVMSHDEVNHVVPAYTYYTGGGYTYDPITHGPLQFHLIALSYTLFGDSDFSARVPDAVFGIAVVAFAIFGFRRYLGRIGALVAGFLLTISPFISFYSRYTRNEIYIVMWGMALIWGVLRYLEFGRKRTLLFVTVITALHFVDKATSYIFSAEIMIFLAVIFIYRLMTKKWSNDRLRSLFLVVVAIALVAGVAAVGVGLDALSNTADTQQEGDTGVMLNQLPLNTRLLIGGLGLVLLIGVVTAAILLVKGIGWRGIRDERSFDLLLMQVTIVLPLLAALPMDILGFNPLDYSNAGILRAVMFILPLFVLSLLIGIWWNWKVWILNIGVFWSIFVIFYTSLFTQGTGFPMGLMGALGYWMAQQGVSRGTQPLYYYALVQIPIYEFLPAFGTLVAAIMGIASLGKGRTEKDTSEEWEEEAPTTGETEAELPAPPEAGAAEPIPETLPEKPSRIVDNEGEWRKPPVLGLLLYWSVMSLIAFSFAGERMPWLTTHITMPMILCSGWSFGRLIEAMDWEAFKHKKGWLVLLVGGLFLLTTFRTFGALLGSPRPFEGTTLAQLSATSTFLVALAGMIVSGVGLVFLLKSWDFKQFGNLLLLSFVGILAVITIRTSYRANFILYDTAQEFLVYAHASRDPKDVLEQVEEISYRTTGGKDIEVAYDNDLLYPYWWYFRDYPNKHYYGENITMDLRNAPIILVGGDHFAQIAPVVANDYVMFEYTRLWWPTEMYTNIGELVKGFFTDPQMRSALWEIWYNRNYAPYASLIGSSTFTLENWQPSAAFRMYIRKDVVSEIWEYGAAPVTLEPTVDPYESNTIALPADSVLFNTEDYQFNTPRDIAFAPDGTFYVADSGNNRILHLNAEGALLQTWGVYGASDYNNGVMAEPGRFNEPWGVAVGPDGSVYVADTWNNRIQKFTAEGDFVTMWGEFGAAETSYHFWGPRGVAVDNQGRVYVTDTGNKRIVIFDSQGVELAVVGGAGLGVGQFDEPVGIEVDDQGRIYVADTWNMRVQVLIPDGNSLTYSTNITWDIEGWYGDSLDNKPFLTIDSAYNTYVADPIMGRVLEFDVNGTFLQAWGSYGTGLDQVGVVGGLAVDPEGRVWVSDALNNRLMRFSPPVATAGNESQLTPSEETGNESLFEGGSGGLDPTPTE